ncbi:MAG: transporter substrate-binding domain-containing protein, partial [Candidatus Magnetominusculus sp. LBB02]|nr:transporter substrate-binding domain-containing protein [Candidatus Magnetominusculus sp. LBB02]
MCVAAVIVLSCIGICYAGQASHVILVGSGMDFPPYAIVDKNGKPSGFSVELIESVAEVMGLSIEIVPGVWASVLKDFKDGRLDLLPLVAMSAERADMATYSEPHTMAYDSFFVRRGSPKIKSLADAKGKDIIVMSSDAAHERLLASKIPVHIIEMHTIPEAMRLLAQGRHDAVLVPKLLGALVLKELKLQSAVVSGPPIDDYHRTFAFAVQRGNTGLADKLNQGIAIVRATGRYDELYDKWFSGIEPRNKVPDWKTIKWAIAIISSVLAISLILVLMLRRQVVKRTAELAFANKQLTDELDERKKIEDELRTYKEHLENMVESRTAELAEINDRFHTAFDSSTVGAAITSPEKGWIEVNNILCEMLGYSSEELTSMTWAEITHPDDLEPDVVQFNRVLAGEINGYNLEKRFMRKDGAIVHMMLLLNCKRKADGSVDHFVAMLEDISERKRMEDALRVEIEQVKNKESEIRILQERLALAIEGSELGAWDWNVQTGDVIMSKYWKIMLGYDVHELDNNINTVMMLMHYEDRENVGQLLEKHFAGETDKFVSEIRYRHKDGSYRWIIARGKVFEWTNDGKPLRMMGTNSDVTHLKQMEDDLRSFNVDLQAMVAAETEKRRLQEQMLIQQSKMAAMGEMIGLIGHQWRQPLNAIGMIVQDIKEEYAYGELNEASINNTIETTMNQVSFMSKTIDDFKNFFKPSKEMVRFNVKAAIEELLSMFGVMFKKSDVDISIRA